MKKSIFIFKKIIYYIIGLISFSTIAFVTQRIVTCIWLNVNINTTQDLYNIFYYIRVYAPFYISFYTLLYFSILYAIHKYDKYIVKKLNTELEQVKKFQNEIKEGGIGNA